MDATRQGERMHKCCHVKKAALISLDKALGGVEWLLERVPGVRRYVRHVRATRQREWNDRKAWLIRALYQAPTDRRDDVLDAIHAALCDESASRNFSPADEIVLAASLDLALCGDSKLWLSSNERSQRYLAVVSVALALLPRKRFDRMMQTVCAGLLRASLRTNIEERSDWLRMLNEIEPTDQPAPDYFPEVRPGKGSRQVQRKGERVQ